MPLDSTPVDFDSYLEGTIDDPGEVDEFFFTVSTPDSIIIRVAEITSALELEVQVKDGGGETVWGPESSSRIAIDLSLEPGEYRIVVEDSQGDDIGDYWLTLQSWNLLLDEALALELEVTVEDSIASYEDIRLYTFSVSEEDSLLIRLRRTSGSLYPWVELRDSEGHRVGGASALFSASF
ncbi:MAG: hypothetical protein GF355_13000, partial [Candidatus Eisenbacteria bacterium]|nr:hypothetical protein [Candidatus Eisenbacteria bacterium]